MAELLPCHECNGTGLIGRVVGARHQCNLCEGEGKFADRRAALASPAATVERVAAAEDMLRQLSEAYLDYSHVDKAIFGEASSIIRALLAALAPAGFVAVPVEKMKQAALGAIAEQRCERGTPWDAACVACYNAVAALTSAGAPAEWQPIETAPKDEAVIIATDDGWVGEARQDLNFGSDEWVWCWANSTPIHSNSRIVGWMPLPSSPVNATQQEKQS